MRKTVRLFSQLQPEQRLAGAIQSLPRAAQRALVEIADREDLPLVAGSWQEGDGGCLVANVCRVLGSETPGSALTFDLRVLELLPEMSSRDLNHLIVAWDEAAMQEGRDGDGALRQLLRGALARAGVPTTVEELDHLAAPEDEVARHDADVREDVPSVAGVGVGAG